MIKLEYYPESKVLVRPANPVAWFDYDLIHLANQMVETMWDNDGVGLAAPQIGSSQAIIVANLSGNEATILVNPRIINKSAETEWKEEGCLSIPGINWPVERRVSVMVEFEDLRANTKQITNMGRGARILQHEIDHLRGWLFPFYKLDSRRQKNFRSKVIKSFDYRELALLEAVEI